MAPPVLAITLEEHCLTSLAEETSKDDASTTDKDRKLLKELSTNFGPDFIERLLDVGPIRLKSMDDNNISFQLVSNTIKPVTPTRSESITMNDSLFSRIKAYPDRLAGFAALPMNDPAAAAAELTRTVTQLGFIGAQVGCHAEGRFYDDEAFWPIFQEAVKLDVPMYLHPMWASDAMMDCLFRGNYAEPIANQLASVVFGWHATVAVAVLRMFVSGFFDRFPTSKIVIGHMGEVLPFMIARVERFKESWKHLKRGFLEVWKSNMYITTSALFTTPPLRCLLETAPVDHVMYSIDYPYSSNEQGSAFLETVEREKIFDEYGGEQAYVGFLRGNAERLFKLREKGFKYA